MSAYAEKTTGADFAPFELDLQREEIRRQRVSLKVQEQPLTIPKALIENP
jgi:hypothetical protein